MAKASKSRRGTKMRKTSRKASRKSRRASRRGRCWKGGANQSVFPASVDDTSMMSSSKLSLAQGGDYENIHAGQHGGAAISLASAAPPGYTGMLDDSLRATARISVLDESMQGIQGMSDQAGGGRRRKKSSMSRRKMLYGGKKSSMSRRKMLYGGKKSSMSRRKKSSMSRRKMLYGGKKSRRSRRQGGGSASSLSHAQDFGAPGMLLSPAQEAQALRGMNTEWRLASDPGAFKPAGM